MNNFKTIGQLIEIISQKVPKDNDFPGEHDDVVYEITQAIKELNKMGKKAVPFISKILQADVYAYNDDGNLKSEATECIVSILGVKAIPLLVEQWFVEEHPYVKEEIIRQLVKINTFKNNPVLIKKFEKHCGRTVEEILAINEDFIERLYYYLLDTEEDYVNIGEDVSQYYKHKKIPDVRTVSKKEQLAFLNMFYQYFVLNKEDINFETMVSITRNSIEE